MTIDVIHAYYQFLSCLKHALTENAKSNTQNAINHGVSL